MGSYAFMRRPRWIVMHVVVLIAVSLFAVAGFWQLWRLDQRRENNALLERRLAMPPVRALRGGEDLEFRRASLSGRYDTGEQVVLTGRPSKGRSGDHLLTPLTSDDDESIVVDRGWVPAQTPTRASAPPGGQITVEGVLLPSEGEGPFHGGGGETDRISRIDVERLQAQMPYDLAPVYLLLDGQNPPQDDDLPVPADLVPRGEGSHLSYAVQWFLFIPTALAVYAAILRREGRKHAASSMPG
jgi:cytochrome oxidase assembly protein ShyY1